MKTKARVIAFYLPQFHPNEINDKYWGKGFTEWTNVAKAKPLFRGHYQPQIPSELGFYDLRLPIIREQQAELAKEHGVEGFCYWHYWFGNGQTILDLPFLEVLETGKPDFSFCLGWANHSWSNKTWTKTKHLAKDTVFIEQTYPGIEDYKAHFYKVLPAFMDRRYLQVDGKPIFLVFDPESIPDNAIFINAWNELAKENGLNGIHFIARVPSIGRYSKNTLFDKNVKPSDRYAQMISYGYDAINSDNQRYAEIKLKGKIKLITRAFISKYIGSFRHSKFDYSKIMKSMYIEEDKLEYVYPQIIPRLDRTPRSGKNARIYNNSTPDKFGDAIDIALDKIKHKQDDHKIIFLQAWNEWGEGNYMEPDIRFGRKYLEVLKLKIK